MLSKRKSGRTNDAKDVSDVRNEDDKQIDSKDEAQSNGYVTNPVKRFFRKNQLQQSSPNLNENHTYICITAHMLRSLILLTGTEKGNYLKSPASYQSLDCNFKFSNIKKAEIFWGVTRQTAFLSYLNFPRENGQKGQKLKKLFIVALIQVYDS